MQDWCHETSVLFSSARTLDPATCIFSLSVQLRGKEANVPCFDVITLQARKMARELYNCESLEQRLAGGLQDRWERDMMRGERKTER